MADSGDAPAASKHNWTIFLILLAVAAGVAVVYLLSDFEPDRPSVPTGQPLSPVERVVQQAGRLMQSGQTGRARDLLREHIEAHPQDADVLRPTLAKLYLESGRPDEALAVLDEILEDHPDSVPALAGKAQLVIADDPEQAMALLQRAADLPDAGPNIWTNYAMLLMNARRLDQAENYLRKSYDAGDRRPMVLQALAQIAMNAGRLDEAEPLARQAAEAMGNNAQSWGVLGKIQKDRGQMQAAVETFEKAIPLASGALRHSLQYEQGFALVMLGDFQAAAKAFAGAAELPGLKLEASIQAARCYHAAGDVPAARAYLAAAEKISTTHPGVLQVRETLGEEPATQPAGTNETRGSLLDVEPIPPGENPPLSEEQSPGGFLDNVPGLPGNLRPEEQ